MSDGVTTHGGAVAYTLSRRAAATICCITSNKAGDNSSVDVSKNVLRWGRSAVGPTTREGRGA
ncbi:UNVERIFIED_CONTAM: hypothetical protein Sradi_2965900 [Sesamum radiatum]|uniref:Uncharacterized protein n=1 Tax=Sesamum radiatum TaxID=300843 RepID=A0AAW2RZK9_SESRA